MMNKKIDIEKIGKRNPYIVPEDYFLALTHNIMDKRDTPKKDIFFPLFSYKSLSLYLLLLLLFFLDYGITIRIQTYQMMI